MADGANGARARVIEVVELDPHGAEARSLRRDVHRPELVYSLGFTSIGLSFVLIAVVGSVVSSSEPIMNRSIWDPTFWAALAGAMFLAYLACVIAGYSRAGTDRRLKLKGQLSSAWTGRDTVSVGWFAGRSGVTVLRGGDIGSLMVTADALVFVPNRIARPVVSIAWADVEGLDVALPPRPSSRKREVIRVRTRDSRTTAVGVWPRAGFLDALRAPELGLVEPVTASPSVEDVGGDEVFEVAVVPPAHL